MFAFIASTGASDSQTPETALARLAHDYGVPKTQIDQLLFGNLQLYFFDTSSEVTIYKHDSLLLVLTGTIINKTPIQNLLKCETDNDAELLFHLYSRRMDALDQLDGHFSFVIFDLQEESITIVADRFHRYSVVYSIGNTVYVSSHTSLLHTVAPEQSLDMVSFSQAVHFRWLTGERTLFKGVRQALPASIVQIDKDRNIIRDACYKSTFSREKKFDLEYWVDQVDSAIDACFSELAKRHEVIGVPLSGGVDSSLLLAKAKEHFGDCVAVTARFKNGENPELANACNIAKVVGVRHIIADIDDEYICDFFPTIIRLHEAPPRNYSDIALARSLEAIKDEVDGFIYGEAADTLFGSSTVHDLVAVDRLSKPFTLMPKIIRRLVARTIPDRGYRLRRLKPVLADGVDSLLYSIDKIPYVTPPWAVFPCTNTPLSDKALNEHLSHELFPLGDRAMLQVLATGVMNHIENTGRLASYFGLQMYVPFVLKDVRSVAMRLPFELQYVGGAYKPVLRELACRYFDREYIYSDKLGFPTPTRQWLKGPLSDRVAHAIAGRGHGRNYYSSRTLSTMSVDEDYEHFWFAICLDELLKQACPDSEEQPSAA